MATTKIENSRLEELLQKEQDLTKLQQLTADVFRVITNAGPRFEQLMALDGGALPGTVQGHPTTDFQGWQIELGLVTVVLDVWNERVRIIDTTGNLQAKEVPMHAGTISADNMERIIGFVTRMQRVAAGETDPVNEDLSLTA